MPAKKKPEDVWSGFVVAVFRLNGLIMQVGEGIVGPLGQSSARWQVLGRAFEPQTVAQMASDMGHARQSVQRVADALVRDGLVAYKAHPSDRRTKLVELTSKGVVVLSDIYQRQLAWSKHVVATLTPAELARATESLQRIAVALESEITAAATPRRPPTKVLTNEEEQHA